MTYHQRTAAIVGPPPSWADTTRDGMLAQIRDLTAVVHDARHDADADPRDVMGAARLIDAYADRTGTQDVLRPLWEQLELVPGDLAARRRTAHAESSAEPITLRAIRDQLDALGRMLRARELSADTPLRRALVVASEVTGRQGALRLLAGARRLTWEFLPTRSAELWFEHGVKRSNVVIKSSTTVIGRGHVVVHDHGDSAPGLVDSVPQDKVQLVIDNAVKFFPDGFDAFAELHPPFKDLPSITKVGPVPDASTSRRLHGGSVDN